VSFNNFESFFEVAEQIKKENEKERTLVGVRVPDKKSQREVGWGGQTIWIKRTI